MKTSHSKTTHKQLQKNLGLVYRTKRLLDNGSLKTIYFSYIHLQLNYANIACGSRYFTS